MRILMICGGEGGISSHVLCLAQCLHDVADVLVCCNAMSRGFVEKCRKAGVRVVSVSAKNGHDFRVVPQIHRVVRDFKPDVVHLHGISLFTALYLKFFTKIPRVCSVHTPTFNTVSFKRYLRNMATRPCYFLAVSSKTWKSFLSKCPLAKGEVFYNPVRMSALPARSERELAHSMIVGMVGRFADVKDWPSFVNVCRIVHRRLPNVIFRAVGVSAQKAKSLGKVDLIEWMGQRDDAVELIGGMDVLLVTSKSEEMPTVVLEAFAMQTPVAGFIPCGGVEEIIEMCSDSGVWRHDRDCEGLADDVIRLLTDKELRDKCVANAYDLVCKKFDAEKNCKGQLMDVYRRLVAQEIG